MLYIVSLETVDHGVLAKAAFYRGNIASLIHQFGNDRLELTFPETVNLPLSILPLRSRCSTGIVPDADSEGIWTEQLVAWKARELGAELANVGLI